MTGLLPAGAIGAGLPRRDGTVKVTGTAPYAFEHPVPAPAYLHPVQSTEARARITGIDTTAAEALEGVLVVLTHANALRLSTQDQELAVLQSDQVNFRGEFVGAVLADTPESARQAADLVRVSYQVQPHDAQLSADRDDLYRPEVVNPSFPTDTTTGDVDAALADAQVTVDRTYRTAMYHNNPMEPHATIATWDDSGLTLYDSTQGVYTVRGVLASVFGIDPERVRVICPYVGGGFGSKGTVHAHVVLAALAARLLPGRPVKFALTRQQMFSVAGYRTPTIQRVRLAANASGELTAISTDVVEQTSRIKEFAEQTAVPTRVMYATRNRRTSHRLARLDVPVPSWMRAPGVCPGMFGPEVAMDELAAATGTDPIELRIRNEPEVDPQSGKPFSSRNLVACLREGARRFGWDRRDPTPGIRRQDGWLVGTGMAASTYPVHRFLGSTARIRFGAGGRYTVLIGAADLGTGAWTILAQIAADALGVDVDRVEMHIGDTAFPTASVAGGSSGTNCWGSAITDAAREFRDEFGVEPPEGAEAEGHIQPNRYTDRYAMHAFGAQLAEVRVREDTGEIRVPRLLGVFAAGRIVNARTARSQFIGGMTMGLSMALHEDSVLDTRFGHVINHDLAQYHITSCADVGEVEAFWIDEHDPYVNPMGAKGIGEIGICGTAAAVCNAVYHATGVRVRDLPITCDKVLAGLP